MRHTMWFAAVLVAVLALLLMLRALTNSMLFYPERGQWRTPSALGLDYEEVWLDSEGDRLQAWWLPGDSGATDGPLILMFHGNAGTIADRLENARLMLDQLGAGVLLAEYPGYGDSTGTPSERSLFAGGRAALEEARRRAGSRPVILFGRSLGGAVAIDLAVNEEIDALIIESSFTSLAELGRALGFPIAAPLLPYRFDSLGAIGQVTAPLFVLHGDQDEIVPFEMGETLYGASSSAAFRRFWTIEGAGHNDTVARGGNAYWRQWREFIVEATGEH